MCPCRGCSDCDPSYTLAFAQSRMNEAKLLGAFCYEIIMFLFCLAMFAIQRINEGKLFAGTSRSETREFSTFCLQQLSNWFGLGRGRKPSWSGGLVYSTFSFLHWPMEKNKIRDPLKISWKEVFVCQKGYFLRINK